MRRDPKAPAPTPLPQSVYGLILLVLAVLITLRVQAGIPWSALVGDFTAAPWALSPTGPLAARHLFCIAAAALFLLGQAALGGHLTSRAGLRLQDPWESLPFGYLVGSTAAAVALVPLGLAGFWGRSFLAATHWGFVLAGGWWAVSRRTALRAGLMELKEFPVKAAGILLLFAATLRLALVPETFYDAGVYHLGLPQLYLDAGRLVPAGWNSYAGIPSQPQVGFLLSLAVDPWGIQANVVHAFVLPLLWAAFRGLGGRMGNPSAGWRGAALFTVTPVVLAEVFRTSVGLESALALFCFYSAGVHASMESDRPRRRGWLCVAGVALGAAAASKYTAWAAAPALLAFMARREDEPSGSPRWLRPSECRMVLGAAAAVVAPWVMKNALHYGNPVYPFFQGLFAAGAGLTPDAAALSEAKDLSRLATFGGWYEFILHPLRWLAPQREISETVGVALPLAVVAGVLFPAGAFTARSTAFLLLSWIPLALTTELTRYFLPLFALAAFLAALSAPPEPLARYIRAGLVALMSVGGGAWLISLGGWRERLEVYQGRRDFATYLADAGVSYPAPQYSAIRFLNGLPEQTAAVLLFGDPRGLYLSRPFISETPDQPFTLETRAKQAVDGAALRERLKRDGIGYILTNYGELSRRKVTLKLDPAAKKVLDGFWKDHTEAIFTRRQDGVAWVEVRRIL